MLSRINAGTKSARYRIVAKKKANRVTSSISAMPTRLYCSQWRTVYPNPLPGSFLWSNRSGGMIAKTIIGSMYTSPVTDSE